MIKNLFKEKENSMNEPTWQEKAAKEMNNFANDTAYQIAFQEERVKRFESIIFKYQPPEEKVVKLFMDACGEFVRKVECGEAQSKRSYTQMKAVFAAYETAKK